MILYSVYEDYTKTIYIGSNYEKYTLYIRFYILNYLGTYLLEPRR